MAVDAVDAAAQQVRADPEREVALEPDRRGLLAGEALVVALERGDRLLVQLALLVRLAEARAAASRSRTASSACPGVGSRSASPPVERLLVGELGVVALEHLVHEDPEALLERLLLRDRSRRARTCSAAGRCGRRRCRSPTASGPPPRIGRYASSDDSARSSTIAPASQLLALGRRAAARRGSSPRIELALLGARRLRQHGVDLGDRGRQLLGARVALDQRRELQQLHVARDRAGRVEVRVEAHLAHPRADLRDAAQHLVAQHPEGGVAGPRGCRAAPRGAPPPRRRRAARASS